MEVSSHRENGVVVIAYRGTIDFAGAEVLEAETQKWIQQGESAVVYDLQGVAYVDSVGMGTLLRMLSEARRADGDIRLAAIPDALGKLFRLSPFESIFEMHATVASAVESFDQTA